ncbi:hypothetical protein G5B38_09960 [Pseudohalocynthiibacter aestuariivivens]|nr:hypothetical protein [Pseudohalocynthiibacter aestuariivivens]QIE45824.1 hypothetical protein G5B38_09960 [Pseudohalocynthiibacter aestuariivivens]
MDIEIERELYGLVDEVVKQGRWLGEEWLGSNLLPKGQSKRFILELLHDLRDRHGHTKIDREILDLMGEQIRQSLNHIREGKGDAAISREVDLSFEDDLAVISYVNLAHRWKQFKAALIALEDKLATIRLADQLLADAI